ncbi:MAG: flavin reductase family protein [Planctomycetota bacterium]|jgi:flavin reductase (DIM6/NTAB) family NADH-FMN oxidoreductase RutF|nr:flavin reductase family protein [Planctomycetota bacterium]
MPKPRRSAKPAHERRHREPPSVRARPRREKAVWPPGNLVVPAPAALISCGKPPTPPNVLAIAWCANVNSEPPMLSISVRPSRLSYGMIARDGEFVVNLPSVREERTADYCGAVSGRKENKFSILGLTPEPIAGVGVPAIAECPLNLACVVDRTIPLGSHDLFLARIVSVAVDESLLDARGALNLDHANLLCFAHGFYHELGKKRGRFGWSVKKRPGGKKGNARPSR